MTAPVPRGGTRGREMPPCLCVCGARVLPGEVCRLVLQAPVGRLGEPDTEPTGGVVGLDTHLQVY